MLLHHLLILGPENTCYIPNIASLKGRGIKDAEIIANPKPFVRLKKKTDFIHSVCHKFHKVHPRIKHIPYTNNTPEAAVCLLTLFFFKPCSWFSLYLFNLGQGKPQISSSLFDPVHSCLPLPFTAMSLLESHTPSAGMGTLPCYLFQLQNSNLLNALSRLPE